LAKATADPPTGWKTLIPNLLATHSLIEAGKRVYHSQPIKLRPAKSEIFSFDPSQVAA
jgi:hypothetical protein